MNENVKWYRKSWCMWTALFFFPLLGLVLLFLNRDKHTRWKLIAVFGVLWLILMLIPKNNHKELPQPAPVTKQQEIAVTEENEGNKATIKKAIESKLGDKAKNITVSETPNRTYKVGFDMDAASEDVDAAKNAAVSTIKAIAPFMLLAVEQYRVTLLHGGTELAAVTYGTKPSGMEGYYITRNGKTEKFSPSAPAPASPPASTPPAPSTPTPSTTEPQEKASTQQVPAAHVNNSGPGPNGETIKGNINRKGERIYHVPGGASYNKTIPEAWFFTEEEAQAAGFRRAKR
mgnify:FL=1